MEHQGAMYISTLFRVTPQGVTLSDNQTAAQLLLTCLRVSRSKNYFGFLVRGSTKKYGEGFNESRSKLKLNVSRREHLECCDLLHLWRS